MIEETREELKQFGVWSRQGINFGRVRSCMQIFLEMSTGSRVKSINITDERAMLINDAVAALMLEDKMSADILCLFYIRRLPEYIITEKTGLSRGKVKSLLSLAEGFVDGFLCSKLAA